jgi:hypothetical protein
VDAETLKANYDRERGLKQQSMEHFYNGTKITQKEKTTTPIGEDCRLA